MKHLQDQVKGIALILFGILLVLISAATQELFLNLWLLGVFLGLACGVIGIYIIFSGKK